MFEVDLGVAGDLEHPACAAAEPVIEREAGRAIAHRKADDRVGRDVDVDADRHAIVP